jgi:hypothetical protein
VKRRPSDFPAGIPRPRTTTDAGGRFEVAVPRDAFERAGPGPEGRPVVAAFLPGLGPDWVKLGPEAAGGELTLRPRRDDVAIEGRVVGLEGRPVPDVSVRLVHIWEDPPDFLKGVRENGGEVDPGLWGQRQNGWIPRPSDPNPSARTGPNGRFRLIGVGRDRIVTLVIHGATIQESYAMVFTASDPAYTPLRLPADESNDYRRDTLHGPRPVITVPPGRVIEGVIRDGDSGRPVARASVRTWESDTWETDTSASDAHGRFRITGQPKHKAHHLEVVAGETYVKVVKVFKDPPGLGPIPVEITLRRGVTVEGRVTNRADGRPARAVVQYYPFRDNPHLKEYPDASFFDNALFDEAESRTDADGRFRAVVLPGGGILAVRSRDARYLTAKPLARSVAGNVLGVGNFASHMDGYQALVPIDVPTHPQGDKESVIPDIILEPGREQRVQVVGPDGRPVPGTRTISHQSPTGLGETVPGTEFTFIHRHPGKAETVIIIQEKQGLGAFVDIRGHEPDPIRVALRPLGTVVGRLVDESGRPRPKVPLMVACECKTRGGTMFLGPSFDRLATGPDGRFRVKGLVPGIPCNIEALKKNPVSVEADAERSLRAGTWTIRAGEVQDWGDVCVTE